MWGGLGNVAGVLGGRRDAFICIGGVIAWMDGDGREEKVQEDMVLTVCV